ncbi:unnamed protein product [Caenorhabditis brenneri]
MKQSSLFISNMALNITEFSLSDLPGTYFVIGGIGGFLFIIYLISILVTFPLYVYVHRLNKRTEKATYFYPITKHFYSVICSMQFYTYVTVSIAIVAWICFDLAAAGSVFIVSFFFAYFVAITVTSVQNILLFFLAFRRFMILFLPNFKEVISINPKAFSIGLRVLYFVYSLIQVSSKVIKIFCGTDSMAKAAFLSWDNGSDRNLNFTAAYQGCASTTDYIYVRIYLAGDALVILAGVLYAFMFLKIRKYSRMTSDGLNNPEKYIFIQTLLIVMTKLMAIPVILVSFYQWGFDDDWAFGAFVLTDVFTTPFVIQGSYLLCNRTNVDTILSIQFKKMKTWKMIICGSGSVSEGRQRRREFKMKIYEARRKARDLIRGDKTISKLVVNVIPLQYLNQRVEAVN